MTAAPKIVPCRSCMAGKSFGVPSLFPMGEADVLRFGVSVPKRTGAQTDAIARNATG
jgi:hypothetical protein